MDQKNLEVLLKLKEALKESSSKNSEKPKSGRYTKQGLEILKEFAAEFTSERSDRNKQKAHASSSSQDQAGDRKKGKSNKKKSASSSPKRRHPDPHAKARFEERALAEAAYKKNPSGYRRCKSCSIPVAFSGYALEYPFLCSRCKSRYSEIDLGIHVKGEDGYSEHKVFQGGSPGLGRRK